MSAADRGRNYLEFPPKSPEYQTCLLVVYCRANQILTSYRIPTISLAADTELQQHQPHQHNSNTNNNNNKNGIAPSRCCPYIHIEPQKCALKGGTTVSDM